MDNNNSKTMKDLQVDQILKGIYQACADAMELFLPENTAQRIDRIILIGTHGTGKTTLANELSKIIGIPAVESVAREVSKDLKQLEDAGVVETNKIPDSIRKSAYQNVLCSMAFWDFMRWVNADVPCIMTRCPLDTIAYAMADKNVTYDIVKSNLDNLKNNDVFQQAIRCSLFIYIPVEFGIENDGVRPTDTGFQKEVDAGICKLIYDFKITPLVVTGSVEERLEAILVKVLGVDITKVLMEKYRGEHR